MSHSMCTELSPQIITYMRHSRKYGHFGTMDKLLKLTRDLQTKQITARDDGRDYAVIDAIDHMFERACHSIIIQAAYRWADLAAWWWRTNIHRMLERMDERWYVVGRKELERASMILWEEWIR